jgi:hypothetical protein
MYIDRTATAFVCHPANTKNPEIDITQDILTEILREIHTQYRQDTKTKLAAEIDFHALWQPAIEQIIPALELFRDEARDTEYRSAISRYYILRKAAKVVQATKSKYILVLTGEAGSMYAKVFVNKAASVTFTTTVPISMGRITKAQLTEGPRVLRANIQGQLNPRIYVEARKKAAAAMNRFRKKRR